MAENTTELHVPVTVDTADVVRVLRIIAKHATACADELETAGREQKPAAKTGPKPWGHKL